MAGGWFPGYGAIRSSRWQHAWILHTLAETWSPFLVSAKEGEAESQNLPRSGHSRILGRLSLTRGHRYHNCHEVSSHSILVFSPLKRLMPKHKWPAEGAVTPQFFCTNCSPLMRVSKISVLGAQPKDASGREGQHMVPDTH